jgi:hypothetical protein
MVYLHAVVLAIRKSLPKFALEIISLDFYPALGDFTLTLALSHWEREKAIWKAGSLFLRFVGQH